MRNSVAPVESRSPTHDSRCLFVAPFGSTALFHLSPQCVPKRAFANALGIYGFTHWHCRMGKAKRAHH